jgi:AcrR family transcriptional regulator
MAVVDADGLGALNMRRLAAELRTKPMSLYRHIPNKAALLDAIAETVLAAVELSDSGADPLETALNALRSFRHALLAHPNALPLFAGPGVSAGSREQFALMEAALAAGAAVGLDETASLRAYAVALAYVIGFVMRETTSLGTLALDETSDADWLAAVRSLNNHEYPRLRAAVARLDRREDPDELFEFGLRALVTGLVPA